MQSCDTAKPALLSAADVPFGCERQAQAERSNLVAFDFLISFDFRISNFGIWGFSGAWSLELLFWRLACSGRYPAPDALVGPLPVAGDPDSARLLPRRFPAVLGRFQSHLR